MITHEIIQQIDLIEPYKRITLKLIAQTPEDQQAILNGDETVNEYISYHFNIVKMEDARPPIYIFKIHKDEVNAGSEIPAKT